MANVLIDENTMTAIGDAIRGKTGKEGLMLPADMPGEIEGIENKYEKAVENMLSGRNGTAGQIDISGLNITDLREGAFYEYRNLQSVLLPDSVKNIWRRAFFDCPELVLPSLPEGVEWIEDEAFYNCAKLSLKSIPEGVASINEGTFFGTNVAFTALPTNLTHLGGGGFQDCQNLSITHLPKGIKKIEGNVFKNCTNLKNITFDGKPDSIRENAFDGCVNLTVINVPWSEGEVANAPWGATKATINYDYIEPEV